MFGIFKKRQPTAMDGRAIYGDHPPAKSADLERAITIAHEDLLCEEVPASEIRRIASALSAGPIPYSTYDLSVATALSFFKDPELVGRLQVIQIGSRLRVLNWMKAGKVAPGVLKIFEDTLYRVYKPSEEAADRDLVDPDQCESRCNRHKFPRQLGASMGPWLDDERLGLDDGRFRLRLLACDPRSHHCGRGVVCPFTAACG